MKIRTWLSNDCNKFITKAGNGFKVPQYEKNKIGLIIPKLDENGKRVYHNLQEDINKFKDTNSLLHVLETTDDISSLAFSSANGFRDFDYTQIQSIDEIKDLQNRLAAQGKSIDDLIREIELSILKKQEALKAVQQVKSESAIKEGDKQDEIKK